MGQWRLLENMLQLSIRSPCSPVWCIWKRLKLMIHFIVCSACCGGAWNFLDSLLLPPQQAAADWECPSESCKTWVSHYDHTFLFDTTVSDVWLAYQLLGLLCKWLTILSIRGLYKSGMACHSTVHWPEFSDLLCRRSIVAWNLINHLVKPGDGHVLARTSEFVLWIIG